jgi:hypothetical protein
LEFLQSFKSLVQMKGWQQGVGIGPTIFSSLLILLQDTALSRFETHASTIGARIISYSFSCLDAIDLKPLSSNWICQSRSSSTRPGNLRAF